MLSYNKHKKIYISYKQYKKFYNLICFLKLPKQLADLKRQQHQFEMFKKNLLKLL